MPGAANPWAGELTARRKKSSVGRQNSSKGSEQEQPSPSPPPPHIETEVEEGSSPQAFLMTKTNSTVTSAKTEDVLTSPYQSSPKQNNTKVKKSSKKQTDEGDEAGTNPKVNTANGSVIGQGKEDTDWLKESRKNLKPVLQPFKRTEASDDPMSPVDMLIAKGSFSEVPSGES